jgi:hypothetical protein
MRNKRLRSRFQLTKPDGYDDAPKLKQLYKKGMKEQSQYYKAMVEHEIWCPHRQGDRCLCDASL